jgi:ABC-type branched-subunit amino acid transport system ATPase component
MMGLIRTLRDRYTILLIEHKMDLVMTVSDRITVMHFGSVLAEGLPGAIQGNADVRRAYLGTAATRPDRDLPDPRPLPTHRGEGG